MNPGLRLPDSKSGRYALLVLAPSLLAWLYLVVLAADGYVSRAQVMVEKDSSVTAAAGAELALGLLNVGSGKSRQDALLAQNFMHSRTMLEHLDDKFDLRGHFSAPRVDFIGRLSPDATREEFLEYFRKHLTLTIDDDSLVMSIEFVAFDPQFAQDVARELVARSETFVNEVSRQAAREQLSFVEDQVKQANDRLLQASRAMIDLQRSNDVLSPEQETEAAVQILSQLEAELARQRTELKTLAGFLNPKAPDMVAARQRVQALEAQVAQERARMVGNDGEGLNDLMLAYQDAEVNVRMTTEIYKTALATLETTRLDSVRKVKYLVSVDQPSLPDDAELPRVLYWTLTVFVFLNLAYFVMSLIIATIEDHRE